MDKEFGVFYKSSKYASWSKIADFDDEQNAKDCANLLHKGNPNWDVKVVGTIAQYREIPDE